MKKLKLNKQTVSLLNNNAQKKILGGANTFIVETACAGSYAASCYTYCRPKCTIPVGNTEVVKTYSDPDEITVLGTRTC